MLSILTWTNQMQKFVKHFEKQIKISKVSPAKKWTGDMLGQLSKADAVFTRPAKSLLQKKSHW